VNEPEQEPTNLTDTVVRGVGLAGAGYVLAQVLTLGFFVVLARLATPADFGDYAAGSLVVSIGLLFTESGMMAALTHRPDRIDEAASTATISTAVSGVVFSLLALAASPLIGLIFDSSRVTSVAAAVSGLLLLRSLMVVPESLLQRRFSFLRRVVIDPVGVLAFGITAVILCANGLGVWGLVVGYYVAAVIEVFLSWGLAGWRPQLSQASFGMWRELIRYGRFGAGATLLERAGEQVPVVLIGHFSGAGALGQFRYAQRIAATPLAVIVQAGSYVIFPALARITGSRERLRGASVRSLRMMCTISFPLGMILIPLGVPIAVLVFGEVWRDAGYAAMALSLYPIAGTLLSLSAEVAKADGRPDIVARTQGVVLITGTLFMLALLPFGLVGVVAGLGLGWLAGGIYGLWKIERLLEIPIKDLLAEAFPPVAAALTMAAILTPLEFLVVQADSHGTALGLVLLAAEGILGLAIYLGALRLLAPETLREISGLVGGLLKRGDKADEPPVPPAAPELEILDEPPF
jgi:O-antigen/teichoic acid export membrane protein